MTLSDSTMTNKELSKVLAIVRREAARWPKPIVGNVDPQDRSPFRVLISTILSLRTKDAVTEAASHRLFMMADDAPAMVGLSVLQISRLIYPVAFYNTKARQIHDISRKLMESHNGTVPSSLVELLGLRGVGRKTANLVLIAGFGLPGICVDTHVHRISNRWGYVKTKSADQSEMVLRKKLPRRHWMTYNDLLVAFGQNQCKPISPWCSTCQVRKYCPQTDVRYSR